MSPSKFLSPLGRVISTFGAGVALLVVSPLVAGQVLSGGLQSYNFDVSACGEEFSTTVGASTLDGTYSPGAVISLSRTGVYTDPIIGEDHRCSMNGQVSATYEMLQASLDSQAVRNSGDFGFYFQANANSFSADRIRVLSKTLPTGTPVTISLIREINWSGAVSSSAKNQVANPELSANPCFFLHAADLKENYHLSSFTYPLGPDDVRLAKAGRRVIVQTLSTKVGNWIEVSTSIALSSMPQVSGADLSRAATSMSTTLKGKTGPYAEAKVYLAVPAGVRLQADSGFKYRCPAKFAECAASR